MRKTIAAVRTDYLGLGLVLTVLFLIVLLNFQKSAGVIRGGDDEGSGIGGTGLIPGESGFGGTGLKPYLGINDTHEIHEVLALPGSRQALVPAISSQVDFSILEITEVAAEPVLAPRVTSVRFQTRDSSPINITEAIQAGLDERAIIIEATATDIAEVLPSEAARADGDNIESNSPALLAQLGTSDSLEAEGRSSFVNAPAALTSSGDSAAVTYPDSEIDAEVETEFTGLKTAATINNDIADTSKWNVLTNYLVNENPRPEADSSANLKRPATEPRSAPTRKILRPELPPVQRARPVERLNVLPPRIQPLRL